MINQMFVPLLRLTMIMFVQVNEQNGNKLIENIKCLNLMFFYYSNHLELFRTSGIWNKMYSYQHYYITNFYIMDMLNSSDFHRHLVNIFT